MSVWKQVYPFTVPLIKLSNKGGVTNCSKEMIIIKQIKKFLMALVIAYIPSLIIIVALIGGDSAFFDTSFAFDLLIVLLYTLPVFVGTIDIVICVIRTIESKKRVSIYNSITMLIALSVIILTFVLSEMIYISVIMTALLLMIELIHWIKDNRKINKISFVKQISFWAIVLTILLAVTLCASAYRSFVDAENKVDTLDGVGDNSDNIVDLEKQISKQYELENFKLIRITIESVDNQSSRYEMYVSGSYTIDAKVELWSKLYEIAYTDFQTLCALNNKVLYNAEKSRDYEITTDVPQEIILLISRIIFE